MRYQVRERMEWIEGYLYIYGQLNRSNLMSWWGISKPQASTDIKRYTELAPNNIRYNKTLKCYEKHPHFKFKLVPDELQGKLVFSKRAKQFNQYNSNPRQG